MPQIEAWARLTGRELSPFALDVFAILERTFFTVALGKPSEPQTANDDVAKKMKSGLRSLMTADKKQRTLKKNG